MATSRARRSTTRCGLNTQAFHGVGSVTLLGNQVAKAKQLALDQATNQVQQSAHAWIMARTCPTNCPLKGSTVDMIVEENEALLRDIGGRTYTIGSAIVLATATVMCTKLIITSRNK